MFGELHPWMSFRRSHLLLRQIFNTQANRNFVRSAVFSERRVSLLHFDRSRLKHTELFDIHEHPVDFVKLVLGLAHPAPKIMGFDDSITFEWVTNEQGKKERCGFVTTRNAQGCWERFKIKGLVPCFQRRDLTGRGTTCWDIVAEDKHGNEVVYLMKESWRSESRTSEEAFLDIAKGLEGVGQMISCEEVISTADLRGPKVLTDVGFNNRVKCRTVLEKYGGPVHEFQTELQLFCAFKDAISGEFESPSMQAA
jgi:Fungal protein kinase